MRKPRLALFTPYFLPLENAEAIVNGKLALVFERAGYDFEIFARDVAGRRGHQYVTDWHEPWLSFKERVAYCDCGFEVGLRLGRAVLEKKVPGAFGGLRRLADANWARRAAAQALRRHREKPFDIILSRSLPEAGHIAAMYFHRKAPLPWIANWNDPISRKGPPPYGHGPAAPLGTVGERMLRQLSLGPDWHTFPSAQLRDYAAGYMPGDVRARSSVIPHVAVPLVMPQQHVGRGKMVFCHNGDLRHPRDPDSFFAGLRAFADEPDAPAIEVTICGHFDERARQSAERHRVLPLLRMLEPRAYLASKQILAESDAALLVEAPAKPAIFLPSKLVDYVTLHKPVLAVTPRDSEVATLLFEHGGGEVAACGSAVEARNGLRAMYDRWKAGELYRHYDASQLFQLFSPETVVGQYQELFESLLR